jgi:membrane dipeptidase
MTEKNPERFRYPNLRIHLMRKAPLAPLMVLVLAAGSLSAARRSPAEARALADRVLQKAIVIDTHADTPQEILDEGYDLADPSSPYMISIPKMRQGHLGAEFFSIWVSVDWPRQDLIHRALDLIDVTRQQVERHSDALGFAETADDIVRLHRQHKIAILMGLEGGHIMVDDLHVLDDYYRLGIRYMTLTHTKDTDWGDSSQDKPRWNGLTNFGRKIVLHMNRLGMMVDISHVSDKTFYDAVAVSKAPVIASHSSCRALCNSPRDMTDDMLRALARNGGVVDINFYPAFLDNQYAAAQATVMKQEDAAVKRATENLAARGKPLTWTEEVRIRAPFESHLTPVSYKRIADHIDHAVQVAGIDHVGLGSDFDGIHVTPKGMEDISKLPNLVTELASRGYSEEDLEKILGGNVLRVMRRVEQVSHEMRAEGRER